MTSRDNPPSEGEDAGSEEIFEEGDANVRAWAQYERERRLESAEAHEPEEDYLTFDQYVEYPHPDPAMQLAKVQRFLDGDAEWLAAASQGDDSKLILAVHPYVHPPLKLQGACAQLYKVCVEMKRAHPEPSDAMHRGATAICITKEMVQRPRSVIVAQVKRWPHLWVWRVMGPDASGMYYLDATTDPETFRTNLLKTPRRL